METNIIRAVINQVHNPMTEIDFTPEGHNRVNMVGESLELYVKNLFAGTLTETDENCRNDKFNKCFSYLGNQNNPPDIIIKEGDAIEVKKIENPLSTLALNSSYPKAKIYSDSSMISKECKRCEDWTVKDIIYIVGVVKNKYLSSLIMVYGMDYAADAETYERIKGAIKKGVENIPYVEFADTKEIGRVNRVDPLEITSLRIRGMWQIENPLKVFNYIYQPNMENKFNLMVLINNEKYFSFDEKDRQELENLSHSSNLVITNVKIKNPNNPAKLKDAKLITFSI